MAWEPVVDVNMLVRRPPTEVWEAFADPDHIRRFWLASASHRLETGVTARWVFKIAGAETDVIVIEAVPGRLLDLRWGAGQPLRISFEDRGSSTLVAVHISDFAGEEPAAAAVETMSGFTLVLASLKLYLEHGIEGDLMYDKFPDQEYADR